MMERRYRNVAKMGCLTNQLTSFLLTSCRSTHHSPHILEDRDNCGLSLGGEDLRTSFMFSSLLLLKHLRHYTRLPRKYCITQKRQPATQGRTKNNGDSGQVRFNNKNLRTLRHSDDQFFSSSILLALDTIFANLHFLLRRIEIWISGYFLSQKNG